MTKLRLQVILLTLCLAAVLAAKHFVDKLAHPESGRSSMVQAEGAETGATAARGPVGVTVDVTR